jgi:hypothetical protein
MGRVIIGSTTINGKRVTVQRRKPFAISSRSTPSKQNLTAQ